MTDANRKPTSVCVGTTQAVANALRSLHFIQQSPEAEQTGISGDLQDTIDLLFRVFPYAAAKPRTLLGEHGDGKETEG